MAKQYQWNCELKIDSGGYKDEEHGVEGAREWQTTSATSSTYSAKYYYRDSDTQPASDANSSKVVVSIMDKWWVSFDIYNVMHVTVETTIQSVERTDVQGTPPTIARHIFIGRSAEGPFQVDQQDTQVGTQHTIVSNVSLGTWTFSLPPGGQASQQTVWYKSTVVGHEGEQGDNPYTDIMRMGVGFKNILPPDYRPGSSLQAGLQYVPVPEGDEWSDDRVKGACHIFHDGSWEELRTKDGHKNGKGNPPLILTKQGDGNSWRNQKLVGET